MHHDRVIDLLMAGEDVTSIRIKFVFRRIGELELMGPTTIRFTRCNRSISVFMSSFLAAVMIPM